MQRAGSEESIREGGNNSFIWAGFASASRDSAADHAQRQSHEREIKLVLSRWFWKLSWRVGCWHPPSSVLRPWSTRFRNWGSQRRMNWLRNWSRWPTDSDHLAIGHKALETPSNRLATSRLYFELVVTKKGSRCRWQSLRPWSRRPAGPQRYGHRRRKPQCPSMCPRQHSWACRRFFR